MEDIVNVIRNVNTVELEEEVEYSWERIEPKTKEKFYRFFFISSKISIQLNFNIV